MSVPYLFLSPERMQAGAAVKLLFRVGGKELPVVVGQSRGGLAILRFRQFLKVPIILNPREPYKFRRGIAEHCRMAALRGSVIERNPSKPEARARNMRGGTRKHGGTSSDRTGDLQPAACFPAGFLAGVSGLDDGVCDLKSQISNLKFKTCIGGQPACASVPAHRRLHYCVVETGVARRLKLGRLPDFAVGFLAGASGLDGTCGTRRFSAVTGRLKPRDSIPWPSSPRKAGLPGRGF
jgi:hypothetical protein